MTQPAASVLASRNDIFDSTSDLLVLPCSAKGTISTTVQRNADQYGIPRPKPMPLGNVLVIPFPPPATIAKFIGWAASVERDSTTPNVIRRIGARLGELTHENPGIRR